jgi:hypothetical protein
VIVEATFKVSPLPEAEQFVQRRCASLDEADAALDAILESPLTPVALDLHNLCAESSTPGALCVVAGFAGAREDVDWQFAEAAKLGFTEAGSLDHDRAFRADSTKPPPQRLSVLPSRLVETLRQLGPGPFVARAGNGVIHHRGTAAPAPPPAPPVVELQRRLKAAFDPLGLLPALPA